MQCGSIDSARLECIVHLSVDPMANESTTCTLPICTIAWFMSAITDIIFTAASLVVPLALPFVPPQRMYRQFESGMYIFSCTY